MAGGRPPKFKSPKELQEKIEAYFESCWAIDDDGKKKQIKPYTITGLALALDTTRETLMDYENKYGKEFSDTIKKAKQQVENYVEEYLFTGKNTVGAIFNLKNNYGWKDKNETDLNVTLPTPILNGLSINDSNKENSES